jgi:rubrerythrin
LSDTPKTYSPSFTMPELLAHALVIELEAIQSYKELAAQMEQCGNNEVAELFEKMSELEGEHAEKIRQQAGDTELPELAPWEYRWPGMESPESIDLAGIHYLMTPHHALTLALENERNAMAFFEAIAKGSEEEESVRVLSAEFADDERQHVAWMEDWLAKYPEPDAGWDDDPDPPAVVE